ncbi:MAG: PqiC family protein [Burkholderiaceae bacterium]|nr:PqiC family protein [Burkholderiaceae bacterium]
MTLPSLRVWIGTTVLAMPALLTACSTPLPAITLLRMPLEAPGVANQAPTAPVQSSNTTATQALAVQLLPVQLAGHLDREALVTASGPGTLHVSDYARWAEPLRESVTRLLRHDLEQQLGMDRLWQSGGSATQNRPTHQRLRVELTALEWQPDQTNVRLQARWQWDTGARAGGMSTSTLADFTVPVASTDLNAIVLAHRQALYQLAGRIAASVPPAFNGK